MAEMILICGSIRGRPTFCAAGRTSKSAFVLGSHFGSCSVPVFLYTINTKIGASDNTTGLGDYCIRIRGYLVSNSSKTIDLFVYLSNTSSNTATVDVVTAHGYRNYGSINPGTLHIFKRNTTSGDGIKIYFTIPSDDRGTFAMNVDLISHDLAKENITNTSSPNSSDNKLLHGWTISNTIVPSGTYLECDSISTHAHEALSVGNGLKYASGDSYTGADARTISVKEDYAFNWAGIHTFTVVPKINLTGVLIGRGSSTQIDAKSGSANRQFLKYTVSNNVGAYGFAAIVKEDLPNISGLNSGASSAGQLLVSGSNGSAAWFPIGLTGQVLQQTSSGLQFKYIHERTTLPLTSSHTSSNPATFTHTAGTDQTVYLILPTDSTATTSFYVRIQSPNSEWAGDKIQFIVINNVTTSPDTYNPIVYFKKYDSNNDKYIGDYGYDSAGIAESALSIASGFMMNLYCVTVGAATIWRAQRISEIGFDQN